MQPRQAYVNGEHALALRLAQRLLKIAPDNVMARRIAGASACYLKNRKVAQRMYDGLAPGLRSLLKNLCARNGIDLGPPPNTDGLSLAQLRRAKKLLKQAQEAYVRGRHRQAMRLALMVLDLTPGNMIATQVGGASACYLKDGKVAWRMYNKLPHSRRGMLKNICARNGVEIRPIAPKPDRLMRCASNKDCVLLPEDPCACPPCGRVQRDVVNQAGRQKWMRRLIRRPCKPPTCPACETTYVKGVAECVDGACAVREQ